MSRRKQARPSRHLECDEDGNGISSATTTSSTTTATTAASPTSTTTTTALSVKKDDKCERWNCGVRGGGGGVVKDSAPSRHPLSSPNDHHDDDEMDDGRPAGHGERIPPSNCLTDEEDDEMHTEDANNNNESKGREVSAEREIGTKGLQKESLATALHSLIGGNFPWPSGLVGPNVTLEAIQNTKVAMAQYAASALNDQCKLKGKNNSGDGSFQELAALQSTLFTLQQQQLLQLQLLQHLQQQLVSKSAQNSVQQDDSSPPNSPSPVPSTSTTPQPPEVNSSGGGGGSGGGGDGNMRNNHNNSSSSSSSSSSTGKPTGVPPIKQQQQQQQQHQERQQTGKPNMTSTSNNDISNKNNNNNNINISSGTNGSEALNPHFASLLNCGNQDPNQPLSPGLPPGATATSILSPNGELNIIREPNTLEVLQKRTQEVLDSASQGLLASSLVDDPNYRKKGVGIEKGREPFFKHRCRYCGKVFSSDSALQIHIRSHTGERPFKCNVCGSRFTTKGNLKVHFQRHTARFPHVRMNPHPVPEHLDHLHPPIRTNSGHSTPNHSPTGSNPFRTPPPPQAFHPFNPLFHFSQPMKLIPLAVPQVLKENMLSTGPEDLTKPKKSNKNNGNNSTSHSSYHHHHRHRHNNVNNNNNNNNGNGGDDDDGDDDDDLKLNAEIKEELKEEAIDDMDDMDEEGMMMMQDGKEDEENDSKKSNSVVDFREEDDEDGKKDTDDCSMDSLSHENDPTDNSCMMMEESSQDQPENLSSKSLPLMYPLPLMVRPGRPSSSSTLTFARISPAPQFPSSGSQLSNKVPPPPPASAAAAAATTPQGIPLDVDPAKDPAIYTNLLPRPGSNDNAWESLIEVTKTSETAKLQQLVDNIDHKVTDPNQCIICQRVLSCKSALQMHYRTHTGERPFKCKICGRTFTTKGNLKTHMGVHRAKPPLRALLQCPVCHKRFTNSLVLQQHIRLHTGEPTDLTPEQIRAAEVKDFPFLPSNHFPPFPPHGSPPLFLSHPHSALMKHSVPHAMLPMHSPPEGSPSSPTLNPFNSGSTDDQQQGGQQQQVKVETQDLTNFPSSLAALENQVKTVTTVAGSGNGGTNKAKFSKSSPNDNNSPSESSQNGSPPSSSQDNPLANSVPSSPAATQQQQQQQQQPFITSTIIPHNNLQFLKVNYVFVK